MKFFKLMLFLNLTNLSFSQEIIDSSCFCRKYVIDTNFICNSPEIRIKCIDFYINSWSDKTKVGEIKKVIGHFNYDKKKQKKYISNRFHLKADRYIEYLAIGFCDSNDSIIFETGDFYRFFFLRNKLVKVSKFSR